MTEEYFLIIFYHKTLFDVRIALIAMSKVESTYVKKLDPPYPVGVAG